MDLINLFGIIKFISNFSNNIILDIFSNSDSLIKIVFNIIFKNMLKNEQ